MKRVFEYCWRLFRNRAYYSLNRDDFWRQNRPVLLTSLVTFIVVVLWRSWPNYVNPNLYVEDTNHYFNFFYGNRKTLSDLLYAPNDYVNILNNLIGMLVAYLDVRLQPYIYALIATIVSIAASMSFSFSGILKNKYMIFIAPFLLGLSGFNHFFYYVTLTYLIYVFVILLLTLLFWEPIKNNAANVVFFLFLSVLIWSGPYSVLTVPVALGFILFFRGKTTLMLSLVVVTFGYLLTVKESTIWLHNIFNPWIRELWLGLLLEDVMTLGFVNNADYLPYAAIIGAAAVVVYFRKDRFYLKVAFLCFGIINGALLTYLLSGKIALYNRILPCHLFISQFFWLFLVLFTLDRFLNSNKKFYQAGSILCVLMAAFIIIDNTRFPIKRTHPVMEHLPEFLEEIHRAEKLPLIEKNRQIIINYDREKFTPTVKVGVVPRNDETDVSEVFINDEQGLPE